MTDTIMTSAFQALDQSIDCDLALAKTDTEHNVAHRFDAAMVNALKTALATQRPLLVRGEPGMGKTQLAQAAAQVLGRVLISHVVNHNTQCDDLKWQFDHVARLALTQTIKQTDSSGAIQDKIAPKHFVSPGPLWWVFNYHKAHEHYENTCQHRLSAHPNPSHDDVTQGFVLLLDEVDKGSYDFSNGLLDAFGSRHFYVPHIGCIELDAQQVPPLVIMTTNAERELPKAFVRRCVVLSLQLPEHEGAFKHLLIQRGKSHFKTRLHDDIYQQAVNMLWHDRVKASEQGHFLPGQAEYLDLLQALLMLSAGLSADEAKQQQEIVLKDIAQYVLQKHLLNEGEWQAQAEPLREQAEVVSSES